MLHVSYFVILVCSNELAHLYTVRSKYVCALYVNHESLSLFDKQFLHHMCNVAFKKQFAMHVRMYSELKFKCRHVYSGSHNCLH